MSSNDFDYSPVMNAFPVSTARVYSNRIYELQESQKISLSTAHQGLIFILEGSGEMEIMHNHNTRCIILDKNLLVSLHTNSEIVLYGGKLPCSFLYMEFSVFLNAQPYTEDRILQYSEQSFLLPFCMHVESLSNMDILLQCITEELINRNFGYLSVIQSFLVELIDLWQSTAQQVFNSFWNTIDTIRIHGSFPDQGQVITLSDLSIYQGTPENPQLILGSFPVKNSYPLSYCSSRVFPLNNDNEYEKSWNIHGDFTLIIPIEDPQEPLNLNDHKNNSFLQGTILPEAPCTLDFSIYSQQIQEGTSCQAEFAALGSRQMLQILTNDNKSHLSLSWHVQGSMEYIRQHFTEHLRLEKIADAIHLNPNYLSTIFRQQTGTTISAYIAELRLEKAVDLLMHTTMSLDDIAIHLGFCDVQHLSKVFQKKYDMRPLTYRKAYKNLNNDAEQSQ